MLGFEYPVEPHTRRHGPVGYTQSESYRDWLRDEFTFRCVYCLQRETWYGRATSFNVEHSIPVSVDPQKTCEYDNLLYSCSTCNNAKLAMVGIPNPCELAFADCLRILENGEVEALNSCGVKLRDALRLNSRSNVEYRSKWMKTLAVLEVNEPELFRKYMGFPDDLPDLRPPKKRVPSNTRPEGVANCFFALRERGELPETY
jgi:HNH endonuclease